MLAEPTFFIEVLVILCTNQDAVDLDRIERELALLKRLEQHEYAMNCAEGCVSCERIMSSDIVKAECEKIFLMTQRVLENEQSPL